MFNIVKHEQKRKYEQKGISWKLYQILQENGVAAFKTICNENKKMFNPKFCKAVFS